MMNDRSYALPDGAGGWAYVEGAPILKNAIDIHVDDPDNPGAVVAVKSDLPLPLNWRDVYSDDELHAFGFREIAAPDPIPPGHLIGELKVIDHKGKPKWFYESSLPAIEQARRAAFSTLAHQRWTASQTFTYIDDDGQVEAQAQPAIADIAAILGHRAASGVLEEVKQNFKLADGVFRAWDAAQLRAFQGLAIDYVQACFDAEAAATVHLHTAGDAVEIATILGGIAWP